MQIKRLFAFFLLALAAGASGPASAAPELQFWHSMDGALGDYLQQIVDRFNHSQSAYKGTYDETYVAGMEAFRAGKTPHVLQVYEVGTANMMAAKHMVKPVYQLM